MANYELMRRVLDHIEAHPEQHSQTHWRCGTTRCFAGWVAELTGATWLFPNLDQSAWIRTPDGVTMSAPAYARQQLGIDQEESQLFFTSALTIADLERAVESYRPLTDEVMSELHEEAVTA